MLRPAMTSGRTHIDICSGASPAGHSWAEKTKHRTQCVMFCFAKKL